MFLLATEFATIAFFLGFMAVMFSAVYWFQQRRRQVRQQAMRALAGALEAQYSENDQMGLRNQLKPFDLFRRERIRFFNTSNLSNILHKKVGEASVYLFDYSYVVSTGKSSKRITQTVFFANNRNWHLPQFTLKPSSWWHKLKEMLGIDADINFPDNPDASEKFWLKGADESRIREQFGPELCQLLLDQPPTHLEGDNFYLISYKPGKQLNTEDATLFFQNSIRMVELLNREEHEQLLRLAELNAVLRKEPDLS